MVDIGRVRTSTSPVSRVRTMAGCKSAKRPSFLIQDILNNNERIKDDTDSDPKHEDNWQKTFSSALFSSLPLPGYSAGHITSLLAAAAPHLHYGLPFPTVHFPPPSVVGPGDALPIPIPLPVYVRTKSSSGDSELFRPKKCRRSRTVFSELQLMGLEKKFETHKYLSTPDRVGLADALGLSQIQVKTWYQNRRMKWKKQVMQGGGVEPPTKPKGRPKKNFEPSRARPDTPKLAAKESTTDRSNIERNTVTPSG